MNAVALFVVVCALPAVWCVHDAANKPFAALACGCQSFA
jgi:hypothetical protein